MYAERWWREERLEHTARKLLVELYDYKNVIVI
jgi:hypothetical protein